MKPTDTSNTVPTQLLLLTEKQVADMLCHSVRTIQKWRVTGHGPRFLKINRSVRYLFADVVKWAMARRVTHTSQEPELPQ